MRATTEQHAAIGFCDTSSPCVGVEHPSFPALFYMDIRADEPSGHTSFFSGYVTREVLALVKTAPDLLAAARLAKSALTHSLSDCWATGPKTGDPVEDLVVCPGCRATAAIDAAIAKATQVRS